MSWSSMVSLVIVTASSMAVLLMSNLLVVVASRNSKLGVFGTTMLSVILTNSTLILLGLVMTLKYGINPMDIFSP